MKAAQAVSLHKRARNPANRDSQCRRRSAPEAAQANPTSTRRLGYTEYRSANRTYWIYQTLEVSLIAATNPKIDHWVTKNVSILIILT